MGNAREFRIDMEIEEWFSGSGTHWTPRHYRKERDACLSDLTVAK